MKKIFKVFSIAFLTTLVFCITSSIDSVTIFASSDYDIFGTDEIFRAISNQFTDDEYGGYYISEDSKIVIKILEIDDASSRAQSIDGVRKIVEDYNLEDYIEIEYTMYSANTVKAQKELVSEYVNNRIGEYSNVSCIGYSSETGISVGLTDINDEETKNSILSIPGVIDELIEFAEFIIYPLDFGPIDEGEKLDNSEIAPRYVYQMGTPIVLAGFGTGSMGVLLLVK